MSVCVARDAQILEENQKIVKRLETLHYRPWEQGMLGREIGLPNPKESVIKKNRKSGAGSSSVAGGNASVAQSVASLNELSRKREQDKIRVENLKIF